MPRRYCVSADWTATYADPITLEAGDPVSLSGRSENWDGHTWLWASNEAGKEGWIPDSLIRSADGAHTATKAYSAVELSCRTGETVIGVEQTHGWVLCRSEDGATGWVPKKNLELVNG